MGTIELKYFIYMVLSFAVAFYTAQTSISAEIKLNPQAEVQIQNLLASQLGGDVRIVLESTQSDIVPHVSIRNIELAGETSGGHAQFKAMFDQAKVAFLNVRYQAWKTAWVPRQRVFPGSLLKSGEFELKEMNIVAGMNRDSWALFLDRNQDFAQLESKNTLLEGQPVLKTQVRRSPDIRKGDNVRMSISSGALSLSTSGVAQESAAIGQTLRVLSLPTKKEMSGVLLPGNRVEVKL